MRAEAFWRDPTQREREDKRNTRRHFDTHSLTVACCALITRNCSFSFSNLLHSFISSYKGEMEETQLNPKKPRMMGAPNEGGGGSYYYKTQLCRRFMEGTCPHGDKCTYAHGFSDLRRTNRHQEPKLCRMFSLNKRCTYGHNCRFLHSTEQHHHHHKFSNAPLDPHAQPQPEGENEGYSSTGYRAMQTSITAANTSTNTVATSSLHKNEDPYRVKFIFKENKLQKINGIYADWI